MDGGDDRWVCPECSQKGQTSHIKPFQMNPTHAIYLCESKNCLFPGSAVKQLPLLKRTPDEMPIPPEMIDEYGLPETLKSETGLNLSHFSTILEVNSLIPYAQRMLNAEKEWKAFINRMHPLEILKNPSLVSSYCDPDVEKLKNISPPMKIFLKHLVPDLDLYNALSNIS